MRDSLMDKRLLQLTEAQQRFDRNNQISIPKIQRVPIFLRQKAIFYKYCTPKIISFGPIHHNSRSLKEGEHYKLQWTSIFVADYGEKIDKDANEACKLLLEKIEDNIEDLKNMFTEDAIEGYNDNDLAWILFVDGCSLLHFMENVDEQCPEALNLKFDRLMYIWRDAILLENQLPNKMLKSLCEEKGIDLVYLTYNYATMGRCKRLGMVMVQLDAMPFHLLDFTRSMYLPSNEVSSIGKHGQMETQPEGSKHNPMGENTTQDKEDSDEDEIKISSNWNTFKSIRDLKAAGIRVVANKTDNWKWSKISFKSKWFSGELRLPMFLGTDFNAYFFLNLIAYEMCPDVHYNYECCSFFTFMDSLVDTAEDVKELRLAGVFQNSLGSDEELANLFNDVGDDLPTKIHCNNSYTNAVAYSKEYVLINQEIGKHYRNIWKTWLAQAYNTHFNTPWTMIAFLAAALALILTFIQTWYAIHPNS